MSRLTGGEMLAVGLIVAFFVLLLWAAFTFIGALLFAWAWNFVVPLFWHTAPHLTWVHALCISFVLGALKGIVQFSTTVNKSKS